MIKTITPEKLRVSLAAGDIQKGLSSVLKELVAIKIMAKRILVELPSIELILKDKE